MMKTRKERIFCQVSPRRSCGNSKKLSTVPSETQSLWGLSFPRHAIDTDTLQTNYNPLSPAGTFTEVTSNK